MPERSENPNQPPAEHCPNQERELSPEQIEKIMEKAFLDYIIRELYVMGVDVLVANYIVTAKNLPAKDFYSVMDFTILQNDEWRTDYKLYINDYLNKHKSANEQIKILVNNPI